MSPSPRPQGFLRLVGSVCAGGEASSLGSHYLMKEKQESFLWKEAQKEQAEGCATSNQSNLNSTPLRASLMQSQS